MRICLTSIEYPPEGKGGIPRQRHILAKALTRLGHEVHVIVQGKQPGTTVREKVIIHTVPLVRPPLTFSEKFSSLDFRLTHSLAIDEQIRILNREKPLDILDVPLWALEGFVSIYANTMPVALWLQTSFTHLVGLEGRPPSADELAVIALEKECLKRAQGILADSQSVLTDFENLFNLRNLQERSRVVRLGIPDLPAGRVAFRRDGNTVEALLVGRLEKRKGTPYLFEILPQLLRMEKKLRVRFIGADNSLYDGFYDQTQQNYPQYFHARWPGLRDRVIFEGSVSEQRLMEAYDQADMMLVPSLYESFGLIYLEAMRAGLPIVTFAVGAAKEIFPQGEKDGALLVPLENNTAFLSAVQDLLDPKRRAALGNQGRERFLATFQDTRMAEETAVFYQEMRASYSQPAASKPRRIFQVMEGLDVGDAVSAITLRNADLLHEMHAGGTILSLYAPPQLAGKFRPLDHFDAEANAALIYHYWNYSRLEDFICNFQGPKAFHFHNITPPEYFSPGSPGYESTSRGYEQLPRIINHFDLLIGDSTFNLDVCRPFLDAPKPAIVVPPMVEAEEVRARPYDDHLLENLQNLKGPKFLFVGRVARNKRQDRLMEMFDAYCRSVDPQAWLYLVGNDQADPLYRAELEALRAKLPSREQIIFTGKVSDEALSSYYRAANVFVSSSEHEGFCVPVIEAMAMDIPVVAYAAAAVPETMGEAGIIAKDWNSLRVAEQVRQITKDAAFCEKILIGQRGNLKRYNSTSVTKKLSAVVRFLRTGKIEDDLITWLNPL
jgi:glycosyltransferase involved in cell wall biosynthesis